MAQEMTIAKHAGICAHCGGPIYVGDEITIVDDMEKQSIPSVAYHWLCWQNQDA